MDESNAVVGFIGLGNMGRPMARNLLSAGYRLKVYNRTQDKVRELASLGVIEVPGPCDTLEPGGIVISMVSDDAALQAIVEGQDGLFNSLGPEAIHLSMSTVSPAISRRLAEHHQQLGATYVACPVLGRPEAAASRQLWMCLSGAASAKERVRPLLEAMGQGIHDFGEDPAASNVAKLASNFLILNAIEALAEAFTFARKNGLDRGALGKFLTQTIFDCPVYQNYSTLLLAEHYEKVGFRLAMAMKDLNLVRDTAETSQVPLPTAGVLHERLLSSLARGRGDLDMIAMNLAITEEAGLQPAGKA